MPVCSSTMKRSVNYNASWLHSLHWSTVNCSGQLCTSCWWWWWWPTLLLLPSPPLTTVSWWTMDQHINACCWWLVLVMTVAGHDLPRARTYNAPALSCSELVLVNARCAPIQKWREKWWKEKEEEARKWETQRTVLSFPTLELAASRLTWSERAKRKVVGN